MPTTFARTFTHTGAVQTFTLPYNLTGPITIELYGGYGAGSGGTGGQGGYIHGTYNASPGDVLHIYVGGAASGRTGGFNGGADGGNATGSGNYDGYGGGGSSDIRIGGTGLANRIACAGGGGGAGRSQTLFNGGGDGGATFGSVGAGAGGGGGGTQTDGGAPGTGLNAGYGFRGSSLYGGDGGSPTRDLYGGGGGGGGGYYGGGGGGAAEHANGHVGGGGGGGSNLVTSLASVIANVRGDPDNRGVGSQGLMRMSWTVRDDVVSTAPFAAGGGMSINALDKLPSSISMSALTSMEVLRTVATLGPTPMVGHAALTAVRAASSVFPSIAMTGLGSLTVNGFDVRPAQSSMSAIAILGIQQTLGSVDFRTQGALQIIPLIAPLSGVSLAAVAAMVEQGQLRKVSALAMQTAAAMHFPSKVRELPTVLMAANGAVVESGALSQVHAALMSARGVLTLTGALSIIDTFPITTFAQMVVVSKVKHPEALSLAGSASLHVTPHKIVLVGPSFHANALLLLGDTQLSNVQQMVAHAALTFLHGGTVLDPPYLIVHGDHNDMAFFTTSEPNRGDVRQLVTNHG